MNSEQVALVQDTWQKVVPISETAAQLFYGRLFEMAPDVKPLFKSDIHEQGRMLMDMIGIAVNGLTRLESIVPAVQNLGKRHAGYGVEARHYDTVGAALLWTLEQGLGDSFTQDVKEAWAEAYNLLATVMKEAAG